MITEEPKRITVAELSRVLAGEIRNIALGRGYIGMTLSVSVAEPDARLQITLRPRSILIKKVKEPCPAEPTEPVPVTESPTSG